MYSIVYNDIIKNISVYFFWVGKIVKTLFCIFFLHNTQKSKSQEREPW